MSPVRVLILVVTSALFATGCNWADRCETPSDRVVAHISGATTAEGGVTLRWPQAVKSDDLSDVWYLAADIQAPGLTGTENIAVWGVNSLTEPGWIGSAEALSRHYTGLDDLGGQLTIDHEEARDARRCTRRLQLLSATPSPERERDR